MKIQKTELAQKLNKVKGVVPKKTAYAALQGVLVKDGYLIASNMEMTVKAKIEGTERESFLIPERAFDLINNLPDGEMEIVVNAKDIMTIKADKIKNKYQTMNPDNFPIAVLQEEGSEFTIPAEILLEAMKRISYAIPVHSDNAVMRAMCLQASGGYLNFVGVDGHVLAWDKVDYEGEFELLIPKSTVDKLKSIGISGEVKIRHNRVGAVFITEELEVHTRLIEGKYFKYQLMFKELPLHTSASRIALLDAMTRAKMCMEEGRPVIFELAGSTLSLSTKGSTIDYNETVELQEEMLKELKMGFDARLILETLKAFDSEDVRISFGGPKLPMMVENGDSDFRAIILPVIIR